MSLFTLFGIGIAISSIFSFIALKVFPHLNLLDYPERYGLKRKKIPYPGGLIFFILSLVFVILYTPFQWLIFPLTILGIISFIDDRHPFSPLLRLLIHILIASFVFFQGLIIEFIGNPFHPGESFDLTSLPLLSFALTVLWIIVIQNAMNWFDGLKGLSVGVSGVGFLTLGIFGLVRQEVLWEVNLEYFLLATFYLAGICIGAFFLFWRGKIILGDTGSQILGFLLAVLSIFAGTKIATTLLVLGLPILDSIFVVFRRLFIEKKSPFKGDLKHLHHNLARKTGESKATLFLIVISSVFGSIAIFLTGMEKVYALIGVILLVATIYVLTTKSGKS